MKSKEDLKLHFRPDIKNFTKTVDDLLWDAYCLGVDDQHKDIKGW